MQMQLSAKCALHALGMLMIVVLGDVVDSSLLGNLNLYEHV